MKKYQWNNNGLRKKSQWYDRLMFVCAILGLVVVLLVGDDVSPLLLLAFLAGAGVCFGLSWRVRTEDVKLKPKGK